MPDYSKGLTKREIITVYFFFQLVYSSIAKYLIENKGYPEELNKPFDLDKDFW